MSTSAIRDNCGFAYAGRGQIMNLSQISGHGEESFNVYFLGLYSRKQVTDSTVHLSFAWQRVDETPAGSLYPCLQENSLEVLNKLPPLSTLPFMTRMSLSHLISADSKIEKERKDKKSDVSC